MKAVQTMSPNVGNPWKPSPFQQYPYVHGGFVYFIFNGRVTRVPLFW